MACTKWPNVRDMIPRSRFDVFVVVSLQNRNFEDISRMGVVAVVVVFLSRKAQSSIVILEGFKFQFQVSGFRFQVSNFRLPGSSFRVPRSCFRFQILCFRFQVQASSLMFQVSNFRF